MKWKRARKAAVIPFSELAFFVIYVGLTLWLILLIIITTNSSTNGRKHDPVGFMTLQRILVLFEAFKFSTIFLVVSGLSRVACGSTNRRFKFALALVLCLSFIATIVEEEQFRHSLLKSSTKSNVNIISPLPKRTFIAANLYNNINLIGHWCNQVERLVQLLGGREAVFISIYESFSTDGTKEALLDWQKRYLVKKGIPHRLVARPDDPVRDKPKFSQLDVERIEFLAQMRNHLMEPLYQGNEEKVNREHHHVNSSISSSSSSSSFSHILFLNDIYFLAEDALALHLDTAKQRGASYDMTCAMDFFTAGFYDRWVTRDGNGALVSLRYPFVRDRSGQRLLVGGLVLPVYSCWNGMVWMKSDPFLLGKDKSRHQDESKVNQERKSTQLIQEDEGSNQLLKDHGRKSNQRNEEPVATQPSNQVDRLLFRASKSNECFSSECFLIAHDLHTIHNRHDIFMHPQIIVAYDLVSWFLWRQIMLRRGRWNFLASWFNVLLRGVWTFPGFAGDLEVDGLLDKGPHPWVASFEGSSSSNVPAFQCIDWEKVNKQRTK